MRHHGGAGTSPRVIYTSNVTTKVDYVVLPYNAIIVNWNNFAVGFHIFIGENRLSTRSNHSFTELFIGYW